MEPDASVHGYLLKNRHEHSCNYHAVLGVVSTEPMFMGNKAHYAQMTKTGGNGSGLPSIDVPEIENVIGSRINVALIDCEGMKCLFLRCHDYLHQTLTHRSQFV